MDAFALPQSDANRSRATYPFASNTDAGAPIASQDAVLHSKQYRVIEAIGEGGMGEVYRAYDPMLERDVALKILKVGLPPLARARFVQEARIGARMSHPHIAQVFDLGILPSSGRDWFSMEYLVGRDLEDLLFRARRQGRKLPVRLVLTAFDRILGALDYAHQRGLVHRDIKPGNIFITRQGSRFGVKLLDFGVAWDLEHETGPIDLCGDPRYCAPEQALGDARLDARADVFSTGMSLFEALAGEHPFGPVPESSDPMVLRVHCDRNLPSLVPYLDASWPLPVRTALDVVIRKACDKDPAARFQSADAMRTALLDVFARAPSLSRQTGHRRGLALA